MDDLTRFLPAQCEHCGTGYSTDNIQGTDFKGLRQVTPGKDAVPVTDVTFLCPTCGISHIIRYLFQ